MIWFSYFTKASALGFFASLLLAGCATQQSEQYSELPGLTTPKINNIKAHMHFLADDLLKGRETGSQEHEIASLYIAGEFAKYGLTPAGGDGSFMQRIKFRKALLMQDSPSFFVQAENESFSLSYPNDYLTGPDLLSTESQVTAPLVFVGYGIEAPELEHNDYEGIDVNGKIVVVLSGKPKSFPTEEGSHLASRTQKSSYAAARGAVGLITISTPTAEKVRPYKNLLNYLHTPSMRWLDDDGKPANVNPELKGSAYLPKHSAERLFSYGPTSLDSVYAALAKDDNPKGFSIPLTVTLTKKSIHEPLNSPNVVGILQGSDPELKNEYIVYTAHFDHIGIAKTVKKDNINNGAMDNASGTAVLMETGRMFSSLSTPPKRSIIFLAVTGEEKGLLGADYYARKPTVPKGSLVANVNLDMPILKYEFADVIAFGANHSDLGLSVQEAAKKVGLTLSDDPWPEQNLFTRSDHYSFVKQGIPAVFLVPGLQSKQPDIDGSKMFSQFLATHYHQPSDDMNQVFNWKAAVTFTKVNFQIGLTLANQTERASWNSDSFFGNTFGQNNVYEK